MMVRAETRKFVEKNRKLLKEVASQTDSPVAPMAAAFLSAVDVERDERSRRVESPSEDSGSDTDSEIKLEDIRRGEDIDGR